MNYDFTHINYIYVFFTLHNAQVVWFNGLHDELDLGLIQVFMRLLWADLNKWPIHIIHPWIKLIVLISWSMAMLNGREQNTLEGRTMEFPAKLCRRQSTLLKTIVIFGSTTTIIIVRNVDLWSVTVPRIIISIRKHDSQLCSATTFLVWSASFRRVFFAQPNDSEHCFVLWHVICVSWAS